MEAESALKGMVSGVAALQEKTYDASFWEELFPDTVTKLVTCTRGDEDCFHLFFDCHLAQAIWDAQKIPWVDTFS